MRTLKRSRRAQLWGGLTATLLLSPLAEARVGDWGDPIVIQELPFIHSASTAPRASLIDSYSCAQQLSESGPEVLYQLQVMSAGVLTAQLEGDNGSVDVDLHLLSSTASNARVSTSCLARDNRSLEQSVSAGVYYLAVDSYAGATQAGPYTLRVSFAPDGGWSSRPVAHGVTLETKRYDSLFGGSQFGSVLRVDTSLPGVEVKPVRSSGCQTTSQLARSVGAVAAINGGYFDQTCGSVSMVKIDGQLFNTNARGRSTVGFTAQGAPMISWVDAGADWPGAHHALGGLSRLAQAGAVQVEWERDQATYSFTYGANPRTGVAIAPNQELILATLDGRTAAGVGASLFDFGQWLVWLGATDALNLDGGGSTTLWTSTEGVVNYPSDNGVADHRGERGVASILAVFAPALQRETEWVVRGSTSALTPGERLELEVFAMDPDGGVVTLSARSTGSGQVTLNDRGDGGGVVSYTASALDPAQVDLLIEARVGGQLDGSWRQTLSVIGGAPPEGGQEGGAWVEGGAWAEGGAPFGGQPTSGGSPTGGEPIAGQGWPQAGGVGGAPVAGAQQGGYTPAPGGMGGTGVGGAGARPIPQPTPPTPSAGVTPPAMSAPRGGGASCEQAGRSGALPLPLLALLAILGVLRRQEGLNGLKL